MSTAFTSNININIDNDCIHDEELGHQDCESSWQRTSNVSSANAHTDDVSRPKEVQQLQPDGVDDPTQVDRDDSSSATSEHTYNNNSTYEKFFTKSRERILWTLLGLLMVGTTVGLSVGLAFGQNNTQSDTVNQNNQQSDTIPTAPPALNSPTIAPASKAPAVAPVSSPTVDTTITTRAYTFTAIIEAILFNPSRLDETTTSAERRALDWLINEDQSGLDPSDPSHTSTIETRYIMALFYFSTQIWEDQYYYLSRQHVCGWGGPFGGVECAFGDSLPANGTQVADVNIIAIWRTDNMLQGTLPPEIGLLTSLNRLGLSSNKISGTIPTTLGLLTNLRHLDLAFNDFSGTIPSALSQCSDLRTLNLGQNSNLVGSLPSELAPLEKLSTVYVDGIPDLVNLEALCDGSPPAKYMADCDSDNNVCTCCTTPCLPSDP